LLLLATYAAIVLVHVNLLSPYFHAGIGVYFSPDGLKLFGNFIGDEELYRLYAGRLLHLQTYSSYPLYPPAYPLLLALAELLHPADPIEAMIIVNIAVSSAVMFPVYTLARQLLARDLSFGAAIVAGFLPASFIFAPALMSENLSTPLFVTAFWLAVRQRRETSVMAGLFGVVLACCFLTKFLFLTVIPFLGAASIVNQWLVTAPVSTSFKPTRMMLVTAPFSASFLPTRLIVIAAAAGFLPVALWSAYVVASGGTVAESLGIHIATIAMGRDLRPLVPAFIPSILGLHGLALVASELPVLPAVLTGIFGPRRPPILLYVILLGIMTAFMWLFVTAYAWLSLRLFDYPQPIIQRYLMMLVPIFVPLAFLGLKQMLNLKAGWRSWRALAVGGLFSLTLATLVQVGLYDRTIWQVPAWTTVIWIGGCDVLYGALGFPVITVTAVTAGTLVAFRLAASFGSRLSLTGQRVFRLGVIAVATAGLAAFNIATGLAGAHFAWDRPYLAINAAHARSIIAIIGDRSRDPRPALVIVDPAVSNTIEASTGIQAPSEEGWGLNLSFWSGRQISTTREQPRYFTTAAENPSANKPRYSVSLARPGADPGTTYQVGANSFLVETAPP